MNWNAFWWTVGVMIGIPFLIGLCGVIAHFAPHALLWLLVGVLYLLFGLMVYLVFDDV
jgi:hypothetical protein